MCFLSRSLLLMAVVLKTHLGGDCQALLNHGAHFLLLLSSSEEVNSYIVRVPTADMAAPDFSIPIQ